MNNKYKILTISFLIIMLPSIIYSMERNKTPLFNAQNDSFYLKARLFLESNLDSIKYYSEKGLKFTESPLDSAYAFRLYGIGYFTTPTKDLDSVSYYLNKAKKIFIEEDYNPGLIDLYIAFGDVFFQYDNKYQAKQYYEMALKLLAENLDVTDQLVNVYSQLALCEANLNNTEKARMYYRQLDSIYSSKLEKNQTYFDAKMAECNFLWEEGKLEEAKRKVLLLAGEEVTQNTQAQLSIYHLLGILHYSNNDLDSAIYIFEKAMKFPLKPKDSLDFGGNLAAFYMLQGNNEKAIKKLNEVIQVSYFVNVPIAPLINYSSALFNVDSLDKAIEIYYRAKEEIEKHSSYDLVPDLMDLLELLNQKRPLDMYEEIKEYIPTILIKSNKPTSDEMKNGDRLLQLIRISDTEIEAKDRDIQIRNRFIIVISIILALLIVAIIVIVSEHRKIRRLNKSMNNSYRLLAGEINYEVRIIIQKFLALDNDFGNLIPDRMGIEKNLISLTNKLKNLLAMLDKNK